MSQYATLALEPQGRVLVVRLNRPEVLNALNTQMGRDLYDLWTRLSAEPGDTRCVILTGKAITAEEAAEWGLVNRVCEPGALLSDALETARTIADNAPLSVRQAKKSIHYGLQTDLMTGYRFEIEAYNRLVDTDDRREGIRAFNEKRKPDFQGR